MHAHLWSELRNNEVADLLLQMSILSEAAGEERFKAIAYRRAATTIRNLEQDIEDVWKQGKLLDLPYIGEGIAKKIDEYLRTGHSTYLDKMQARVPPAALELMQVPGIGPKTAYKLAKEAGIRGIQHLEEELEAGRLNEVLGEETSKRLLEELKKFRIVENRMLIPEAEALADILKDYFKSEGVDILVAGSFRRRKETIGDLDLISTSGNASQLLMAFKETAEVIESGEKRTSVRLKSGVQVDLRVFDSDQIGSALLYFTGSKEHNIELRKIAIDKGWKLNEYGLFDKLGNRIAGRTEEEVYKQLGLRYIEPELRENRGEIEASREGKLPSLVKLEQIKGDLQMHTSWSDGTLGLREMAEAAKNLGYSYIAVTDHSVSARIANGLSEDRFRKQWKEIEELNEQLSPFRILRGVEVEVRGDGRLDFDNKFLREFDLVGASIHQGFRQSPDKLTMRALSALSNPYVHFLCHPTNRLIGQREGHKLDMPKLIGAARDNGKWLEVNGQPNRLDLNDLWAKRAVEEDVKMVVNSDAHSEGELLNIKYGIYTARRGWLQQRDVMNTLSIDEILKALSR